MLAALWRRIPAPVRRTLLAVLEPPLRGRVRTRSPEGVRLHGDLLHAPAFLGLALRAWQVEPLMRRLFLRHLGDGRDVVDVGAYIGFYALLAARTPGVGRVWAFEPDPYSYALLARNVASNRVPVACVPFAVSDRVAPVRFTVLERRLGASHVGGGEGAVTVPAVTLDAVLGSVDPRVGILKLDVEGHEIAALHGARELISRCRPVLFVEHDHRNLAAQDRTSDELLGLLDDLDYDVRVIDERHRRIVRPSAEAFAHGHVNLYARPG